MLVAQRSLTLEEFLELPEEKPTLEYVNGVVTQKVSPKFRHIMIEVRLPDRINRFAEPRKLAFAFPELRTTFGGASLVPDISILRWDRIPIDADGELPNSDFAAPPDVAIEVISPGQTVTRLLQRCRFYVDNGVPVALLARPRTRTVTVVRAGLEPVVLSGSDHIDFGDLLPGFELTVDELFDSTRLG